jgi:hypothetical protein
MEDLSFYTIREILSKDLMKTDELEVKFSEYIKDNMSNSEISKFFDSQVYYPELYSKLKSKSML